MKKYSLIFVVLIFSLFLCNAVTAAPSDVTMIPLTRYSQNTDCYGFYKMCGEYGWLGMVFNNTTAQSYTITFPSEIRSIGANGTTHSIDNLRCTEVSSNIVNFMGELETALEKREGGTKFSGSFTLPANSAYAVFLDFHGISNLSNKWNDDVQFAVTISGGGETVTKTITGPIAQRGTACSSNQVCSATVLSGSYTADGSGSVIVNVKNMMPMTAEISGKNDITILWTDNAGKQQTTNIENGVVWNANPGFLGTGGTKTVTGTLKLPVEIASTNRELTIAFHFFHPSSLFFGNFYTQGKLYTQSGLSGVISGNYDTSGSNGAFSARINNYQNQSVSFSLPTTGRVTDSSGKSSTVSLSWAKSGTISLNAQENTTINGTLRFNDTGLIHANSSLILSADLTAGSITGTVAGTITRNPDPNPALKANRFCRDYTAGNNTMTFTYELESQTKIDMVVELASTLHIPGQVPNRPIEYTACQSSGKSCMNRISGKNFTIEAGETVSLSGKVNLIEPYPEADAYAETSLRYFPDQKTKVLYVGIANESCSAQPDPTPTPSVTPEPPQIDISAGNFCKDYTSGSRKVGFQYVIKNESDIMIPISPATTLWVEGFSGTAAISYTACKKGTASCMDQVKPGQNFNMAPGDEVIFSGEAALPSVPSNPDFQIRTSLVYFINNEPIAKFIGLTKDACSITPVEPEPVTPDLTTVSFCRINRGSSKLEFRYTLRNNTTFDIVLQLAKTMAVEGQQENSKITYTGCSVEGETCTITGENFTLKALSTASFIGNAPLSSQPSKEDFYAYTSLIYTINGISKTHAIGKSVSSEGCSAVPEEPTEPPVSTDLTITANSFYRSYDPASKKVTFTYTLVNDNDIAIPVELAKTIAADGQDHTISTTYTRCSSAENSCMNRIDGYNLTLEKGETVVLTGEITLEKAPVNNDFWIYTSMVYTPNGIQKVLDIGKTKTEKQGETVDPEPPVIDLTASGLCRDYTDGNTMIIVQYTLKNNSSIAIPVELATTLQIEGQNTNSRITYKDCKIGTDSCTARITNGKDITLNAGEEAVLTGQAVMDQLPKNSDFKVYTSLVYRANNVQKALSIGESKEACTAAPVKPEPVSPDLTTASFCRTNIGSGKVAVQYALQNNTESDIILQLAKTLQLSGLSGMWPITYSGYTDANANSGKINDENFTLKAGETVRFEGTAAVNGSISASDFTAHTSLVYTVDGTTKPFNIGETISPCTILPVEPVTTDLVITAEGFCRNLSADKSRVLFTYTLSNNTEINIPIQLAKSLEVDGQTRSLTTTYYDCESSVSGNCTGRIKEYDFTLNAGEKAAISGEATLEKAITNEDFKVYTSLVYFPNNIRKVLELGQSATACFVTASAPETALTAETPVTTPEPDLALTLQNAYYNSCGDDKALHFTIKITNCGTATGYADLSAIGYSVANKAIPADSITYSTCSEMSVSGNNTERCTAELSNGRLTIDPGVELSLEGSIMQAEKITENTVEIAIRAEGILAEALTGAASSTGTECKANVEAVEDAGGNEISANVSAQKDTVTLTIQLVNTGNADAVITLGSINLHQTSINNYAANLNVETITKNISGKDLNLVSNGEQFRIPAGSAATLSVTLNVNLAEAFSNTADVSWNLRINNEPTNLTGTVNFAQNAPTQNVNPIVPTENGTLHFYLLSEPQLPEKLPATGFPTHGINKPLSVQPDHLKYQNLNGLHLDIPVLNTGMDLVRIPLKENGEWAVEWLTDQAGVLSSAALPGQGTSLIAAHNHLNEMNVGPFLMLGQLETKDRIFVTDENGKLLSFSVYDNELFNPTDSDLIYQKAIPGSLVLMTCESEMPEGGYAYRRVVFAEPLQ